MNNDINEGNTTNVKSVTNYRVGGAVKSGITFGTCLSMIISYTAWKSIGWAIIHGLLSWVYVIYYLIKYV